MFDVCFSMFGLDEVRHLVQFRKVCYLLNRTSKNEHRKPHGNSNKNPIVKLASQSNTNCLQPVDSLMDL
jgi:hypothetical protein